MEPKSDTTNSVPADRQAVWEGLSGSTSDPEDLDFDEELASFDFDKYGASPLDGSPGDDTPNEFDGLEFGTPKDDVRPPSLEPIDGSFEPIDPVPHSPSSSPELDLPIGTIAGSPIGSGIESIASSDEEESDCPSRPATPPGAIPADGIFSSDESGSATDSAPESDSEVDEEPKPLVPVCKDCGTEDSVRKLQESGLCAGCEVHSLWETRRALERAKPPTATHSSFKSDHCHADGTFHCHAENCDRVFEWNKDLIYHVMSPRGHNAEESPNHPLRWRYGKRFISPDHTIYRYKCEYCLSGIGSEDLKPVSIKRGIRGFATIGTIIQHYRVHHCLSDEECEQKKKSLKVGRKRKRTAPDVGADRTCC